MKDRVAIIVMLAALVGSGLLLAQTTRSADVQFKAAQHKEEVEGDLRGAIELYRQVVEMAGSNRALAAQALLREADLHQKLGDGQALSIYQRIPRDFSDQAEVAAAARHRLESASRLAQTPGDRMVWDASAFAISNDGRVSPDGRYVSYINYASNGNLMLHDLATGDDRVLTDTSWDAGAPYSSTFSPDGRRIAYGWRTTGKQGAPHINDLRILSIEATTPQPQIVFGSPDVMFFNPTDWSRDGRLLALEVTRQDRSTQIGVFDINARRFDVLKTAGWRGSDKIFFSPDGKYVAYDLPATNATQQRDVFITAVDGSRDTRVVDQDSNDIVMGWTPDGTRLLFASDKAGGLGLWVLPVAGGRASGAPFLLRQDIQSPHGLGLSASGTLYVLKDASTRSLQLAPIDLATGALTGPASLVDFGTTLPDWSPDGRTLLYGSGMRSGRRVLSMRDLETGRVRTFEPRLLYFPQPKWMPDMSSILTWGRDLNGREAIFRVDVRTQQTSLVVDARDIQGVQVSPDGKRIYYILDNFQPTGGLPRFVEHDLESDRVRNVWQQRGAGRLSPDGTSLLVIAADSGVSRLIVTPVEGGASRELARVNLPEQFRGPQWAADGSVVVVKSRGTSPNEDETFELWLIPASGQGARKLDVDTSAWVGTDFRLSPDGRQIAFFMGKDAREVWAIENAVPARQK